jgi:hypothetical protein
MQQKLTSWIGRLADSAATWLSVITVGAAMFFIGSLMTRGFYALVAWEYPFVSIGTFFGIEGVHEDSWDGIDRCYSWDCPSPQVWGLRAS